MKQSKRHADEALQSLEQLCRTDYITAILLSTLTLGVYGFTAAPGVTMEDSGDFILGVLTLGIVHQPGYPLYTILGHLFSYLPLGDPAFSVNLFSAVWGALCLGVIFLNLRILSISSLHAVFASLSLGLTTVFWSKTAIAEVYSFNAFLLSLVVFWILSYNRDKLRWQLHLAALSTGLALSNHYPLVVFSGLGLIFLLDRKDLQITDYLKGLLVIVLGLTPYLYLFIQAHNPDLQYNFGKLTDAGMVLDHILRKADHNQYGGTLYDKMVFARWFVGMVSVDFFISTLFIASGLAIAFKERWRYRYPFLIAFLASSFGLIAVQTLPGNQGNRPLLLDFSVPAYLFLSFFLALGLKFLASRYAKNGLVHMALLFLFLLGQFAVNFRSSSQYNNKLVTVWGEELLNSLKPHSILILCSPANHALNYLHLGRGLRNDVTLYDRFSAYTRENLYGPGLLYKRRHEPETFRLQRERQLIETASVPVYYSCKGPIDELGVTFSATPFGYRVDKNHREANHVTQFPVSDRLLEALVKSYPRSDARVEQLRTITWDRLISYYGGHQSPETEKILQFVKRTPYYSRAPFLLSVANNLYFYKNYDLARRFYHRADELSSDDFGSTDLAVYCNLLANAKDYDRALNICSRQEVTALPCAINTVNTRQTIAAIYKETKEWSKVAQYSRRILECQPDHKVAQAYLESAVQNIKKKQFTTEFIAIDDAK